MALKHAPFVVGFHCAAHKVNLVCKAMDELEGMMELEDLVEVLAQFFQNSSERTRELVLTRFLTEGNDSASGGIRPQRSVATRWMSMLLPLLRVWNRFVTFCVHFAETSSQPGRARAPAKVIYSKLMDVRSLITLTLYLPMLRALNHLLKVLQTADAYVLDNMKVGFAKLVV